MRQFTVLLLLLPTLLFARLQTHSGRPVLLEPVLNHEYDITGSVIFLEDPGNHLSISKVLSGALDSLFSETAPVDNIAGNDHYFWVKAQLRPTANVASSWILKTDKLLSEATAFIIHDNGKTDIQNSGWNLAPNKRTVADGEVIFSLQLKERETVTIYFYIHTDLKWSSIDHLKFTVIPERHWNSSKLRHYNFLSVYAGICLLAAFYWLINFIFSSRANYLYLVAATVSALLFCLDIYGVTSVFWSSYPWYILVQYGHHYLWFPIMVLSHFALSYKANSFIVHFPKTVIYCYWGFCFTTVAFLMVSPAFMQWKYSHSISLVMVQLCMVMGVVLINFLLWKRGFGSTGFAFLAILPIFSGISVYILISFGLLQEQYKIITPIGALATLVMYFYGMVHYVRVLREKRNNEILKNDQLIREQNIVLERTVDERTRELKRVNEELLEAEKIKANELIKTMLKEQELKSVNNMLDVQENERKRIATDLHDRLGSMLSTVKLYFSSVEEQIDKIKEQNKEQYNKATSLLDEACDEVRKISHDLVSGELSKFGIISALNQLKNTIENTGRLKINVLAFGMDKRLDNSVEIAIYRIIQELINNILKHANATTVTIQFNRVGNNLNILVEDDGTGFDLAVAREKDGIGLKNIENRVGKLEGCVHIDASAGRGTTTIIDLPV